MSDTPSTLRLKVSSAGAGARLDKFLSSEKSIGSRTKATRLIDAGAIVVNGKVAKASLLLHENDEVVITQPDHSDPLHEIKPLERDLDIVHEDADLLVVNKPAGLVVHPAAGHSDDTLVNILVAKIPDLAMGLGDHRPGLVHRLDKETSGLLVIAKNDRTQQDLGRQFKERTTHRIYQALVFGAPASDLGTCRSWLARHPVDRKRFASIRGPDRKPIQDADAKDLAGKWAVTHYEVLQRAHGLAFLKLKLETGRTHQIRVHLSEAGHPLVGDSAYGGDRRVKSLPGVELRRQIEGLERFFLHARELGFHHPSTGHWLEFSVEWPKEDHGFLSRWGFSP